MKKLHRSVKDHKIFGVCGGLAEYADLDVSIVRLITLVGIVASGIFPGVLAYLVAAAIIPKEGV